jgi:hypothetical protein
MNHTLWMLAVTYPEWLNWIAIGRIRCNGRVTRVNGIDDQIGFNLLLDRSPDISIDDDQAYILAKLKPNFRSFQQDVLSASSQELAWLPVEAVEEFLAVSDRGARLIEADSHRAKVKLGPPVFQTCWKNWTQIQKQIRADDRGRSLVKVLGLSEPDLNAIPKQIFEYLEGSTALPKADKASDLRATAAFAWASSFAIFGELVGDEEKRKQTQELDLRNLIEKLRKDFAIKEPVSKDRKLKEIAANLSAVIKTYKNIEVSILQLAVCFHYSDLINSGKEISLSSLVKDIGELILDCGSVAGANAAYFIGKCMDDIAVSTLVYSSVPQIFPALIPQKISHSIDVGKYVTDRQYEIEIEQEKMRAAKLASEELGRQADGELVSQDFITSPLDLERPAEPNLSSGAEADRVANASVGLQQLADVSLIEQPVESAAKLVFDVSAKEVIDSLAPSKLIDVINKPHEQINGVLFENALADDSLGKPKPTSKPTTTKRKKK